jgi:hypothetical protein
LATNIPQTGHLSFGEGLTGFFSPAHESDKPTKTTKMPIPKRFIMATPSNASEECQGAGIFRLRLTLLTEISLL